MDYNKIGTIRCHCPQGQHTAPDQSSPAARNRAVQIKIFAVHVIL